MRRQTTTVPSPLATSEKPADLVVSERLGRSDAARARAASLRAAIIPVVSMVYAGFTWDGPNRPAMAGVAAFLLLVAAASGLSAGRLSRSRWRWSTNVASILAYLVCCAALAYLDGGISGPLGAVVLLSLPFLAIMVPPRLFAAFGVVSVLTYWFVAVVGEPGPRGYAWVYTVGYLTVSVLCARYAGALASLRRRLTEVTRVDPLTGCLNRRGFDERLAQELSRSSRSGKPVTLVLVDLDKFKAVNDTYGHHVGDELLAWTGRTLREKGRANDTAGRIGGDEFAVILPATGADDAALVVERLHAALDGTSPASMGAATFPHEGTSAEALKHTADQRVYADKATRTGQVIPSAEVIAASASTGNAPKPSAKVSGAERRQRSVAEIGWISLVNGFIGVFYVGLFPGPDTPRAGVFALALAAVVAGAAAVLGAGRLARSRAVGPVMTICAPILFVLPAAITWIDGGLGSPVALGLLIPLPLVALTSPVRASVPVITLVSSVYVAIGVVVGSPSWWYLTINLAGILAISIACGLQGRTAAQQRKLLTQISRVDSLTDLLNRRGFEERFAADLAHARRHGSDLSLLVMDLDGFKQLNDTAGHAAGDELLCWVGETMVEVLRGHDTVGRLGGDEFIALLADCSADEAPNVVHRLGTALGARTEASIGLATFGPDGNDFDALYRHADTALYVEKQRRKASRRATDRRPTPPPAPDNHELFVARPVLEAHRP